MSKASDVLLRFKPEITLAAIILVFSGMLSLSYHMNAAGAIRAELAASPAVASLVVADGAGQEGSAGGGSLGTSAAPSQTSSPVAAATPAAEPSEGSGDAASAAVAPISGEPEGDAVSSPAATPSPDTDSEALQADVLVSEEAEGSLANGTVVLDRGEGTIVVRNRGKQDRIWDVNVHLEGIDNTTLTEDVVHISELKPGEEKRTVYEVRLASSPIVVEESLDADVDLKGRQDHLVFGDETTLSLTISIANPHDFPVDVSVTRPVPVALTSVRIDASSGEPAYDDAARVLTWSGTLAAGGAVSLTLAGKLKVTMDDSFATEPGSVSIAAEELLSGMNVTRSEGMSSNRFAIDKRQDAKAPERWYITVFFKNLSEFDCRVNQIDLLSGTADSRLLERFLPDVLLKPGATWEKDFVMTSATTPSIGHRTSISMIPNIVRRQRVRLSFGGTESSVGRASISKSFDRSTIKLGEREVVAVSIFVQSTGTAPINSATVEDEVPEGFEVRAVKVELDDSNVRKDVTASARVSVDEGVATFTLKDIRSAFGKPMEKGDYFEVSYELVSNGAIEGTYETDVRGWANTDPAGSRITLERTEEAPLMKVTKSLQGIFVSKDLVSTQNDDEIKFVIYVKNKGHVPMTDVVLRDLFPKGFDLVRSSDEFKVVQATDKGSVVEWTIARLDVNEEHRVTYVLKGAGEYSISEAVVMIGG